MQLSRPVADAKTDDVPDLAARQSHVREPLIAQTAQLCSGNLLAAFSDTRNPRRAQLTLQKAQETFPHRTERADDRPVPVAAGAVEDLCLQLNPLLGREGAQIDLRKIETAVLLWKVVTPGVVRHARLLDGGESRGLGSGLRSPVDLIK